MGHLPSLSSLAFPIPAFVISPHHWSYYRLQRTNGGKKKTDILCGFSLGELIYKVQEKKGLKKRHNILIFFTDHFPTLALIPHYLTHSSQANGHLGKDTSLLKKKKTMCTQFIRNWPEKVVLM